MTEIIFTPVKRSDTLAGAAFFPEHGDLLVQFKRNNAVYLYKGADETLFKRLVSTPHPWSKFRGVVQELPYELVSKGLRQEPLKVKRVEIKGGAKKSAPVAAEKPATVTVTKRGPGRPRADGTPAQPRVVVDGKKVQAPAPVAEKPKRTRRATTKPAAEKLTAEQRAAHKAIAAAQAKAPKI